MIRRPPRSTLFPTRRSSDLFSAGPAVLPVPVLEEARAHMLALPDVGMSVMEISHRSKAFDEIIQGADAGRSEEHTSELQSRGHLVCRLLLEKKKKTINK